MKILVFNPFAGEMNEVERCRRVARPVRVLARKPLYCSCKGRFEAGAIISFIA
jgi:hypothetical protein